MRDFCQAWRAKAAVSAAVALAPGMGRPVWRLMKLKGLVTASRHAQSPEVGGAQAEAEVIFDGDSYEDSLVHAEHTVHVTGVITKEDTAKRCEHTEQVGLDCDGGLNPLWVEGGSDDSAARH
jgi:hypothetical protein